MPEDLDTKRQRHLGTGIALGAGIGTALGIAFDNLAIGISLGAGLGLVLGSIVGARRVDKPHPSGQSDNAGDA